MALFALALAPASASAEEGGSAASWGANGAGELGRGFKTKHPAEPGSVVGLPEGVLITQMAAGNFWSLALMANHQVWAVGSNTWGAIGNGQRQPGVFYHEWVNIGTLNGATVTALSAGGDHALALTKEGKVFAWGANLFGERGNGKWAGEEGSAKSEYPEAVTTLAKIAEEEKATVTAIASGKGTNFARLSNGKVEAWGDNDAGQLGIGVRGPDKCYDETPCSKSPRPVQGIKGGDLKEVEKISAGLGGGYALLENHTVVSWGNDDHGQLGNTSVPLEPIGKRGLGIDKAVEVEGLSGVEAIAGGDTFALALTKESKVLGWGGDSVGQIGENPKDKCIVRGKEEPCSKAPKAVAGGELGAGAVAAISAGSGYSLLLSGGEAYALGTDKKHGQLGDGKRCCSVWAPQRVHRLGPPQDTVVGIVAGQGHAFAILQVGAQRISPVRTTAAHDPVAFGSVMRAGEPPPEITVEPELNSLIAVWTSSAPEFKIRWKRSNEGNYANRNGEWITGPCEPCSYQIESFNGAPLGYVPYDIQVAKHEYIRGPLIGQAMFFKEVTPLAPETPIVTGISPDYGPHTGGTTVTITGENLDALETVWFGSTEAQDVTVESENAISATVPEGTGTLNVTVEDEEGRSSTPFTYEPVVSGVTPNEGPTTGGTSVTITGGNFSEASAVKFGSVSATSFTVNSDSSITATAPPETESTVDVTVTSPWGTSAVGPADRFTFTPSITHISPNSGSMLGGTAVTVNGTGFATGSNATKFEFGSTAATAVYCGSSSECIVVSPKHETGTVDVRATVSGTTSPKSAADQFTYN